MIVADQKIGYLKGQENKGATKRPKEQATEGPKDLGRGEEQDSKGSVLI